MCKESCLELPSHLSVWVRFKAVLQFFWHYTHKCMDEGRHIWSIVTILPISKCVTVSDNIKSSTSQKKGNFLSRGGGLETMSYFLSTGRWLSFKRGLGSEDKCYEFRFFWICWTFDVIPNNYGKRCSWCIWRIWSVGYLSVLENKHANSFSRGMWKSFVRVYYFVKIYYMEILSTNLWNFTLWIEAL